MELIDDIFGRCGIALVFLWGLGIKLLVMGYKEDKANGPETPFKIKYLWRNSNKWRIMGSVWFLVGLAFVAPHEGFERIKEETLWDSIPVGHLGVGAIGYLGDEIFVGLDGISQKIKDRFNKKKGE